MKNEFYRLKEYIIKHPIILLRQSLDGIDTFFDGTTDFTLDCPLDIDFHNRALCIVEFFGSVVSYCCLGWGIKNNARLTFKKVIKIENFGKLRFISLKHIIANAEFTKHKFDLEERFSGNYYKLTPMTSEKLLDVLIEYDYSIMRKAADTLGYSSSSYVTRQHDDALKLAFKVFGIEPKKKENYEIKVSEDMAISLAARTIQGYILKDTDYGKSVFRNIGGDGILTVYEAHRNALERLLGVDLIYINEPCNNIVMVQYKMLERNEVRGGTEWVYKSDGQLEKEIDRMVITKSPEEKSDYRLNENPFYLRFIKRFSDRDTEARSINISLEHYKQLAERQSIGGVKISYDTLKGTYLRETEFVALIHSGYIGTHSVETELLIKFIEGVRSGNREVIVAWQHGEQL